MKKSFTFLTLLCFINISNAQWANNSAGDLATNQSVQIGNNGSSYHYDLWHSSASDVLWFSMNNNAKKNIFSISYNNNNTYMSLKNRLGSDLFKVSILGNDDTMFMHLPKLNSRVVIGSYGTYLQSEGHKLVVKSGSAKIEGNLFSTGSVGIGTMSFVDGADTYKLSVDGKIRADGVKVYTDWADYVFEDTYKLPTLAEVENYIKEHGHLKNIPSAREVEENGIELGEMNKLLLQKIEELTLYTIELKKEVNELKSKIN